MDYQIEHVTLAAQPAIALRETLPVAKLPEFFQRAFSELGAYMGEAGAEMAGPPFARYYSVAPEAIDVEAIFPLAEPLPGRGRVYSVELAAGPAVQLLHTGPYDQMAPAYQAIEAWLAEHGKQRSEPPREVYLTEPGPDPALAQTLIVQPVVSAR